MKKVICRNMQELMKAKRIISENKISRFYRPILKESISNSGGLFILDVKFLLEWNETATDAQHQAIYSNNSEDEVPLGIFYKPVINKGGKYLTLKSKQCLFDENGSEKIPGVWSSYKANVDDMLIQTNGVLCGKNLSEPIRKFDKICQKYKIQTTNNFQKVHNGKLTYVFDDQLFQNWLDNTTRDQQAVLTPDVLISAFYKRCKQKDKYRYEAITIDGNKANVITPIVNSAFSRKGDPYHGSIIYDLDYENNYDECKDAAWEFVSTHYNF